MRFPHLFAVLIVSASLAGCSFPAAHRAQERGQALKDFIIQSARNGETGGQWKAAYFASHAVHANQTLPFIDPMVLDGQLKIGTTDADYTIAIGMDEKVLDRTSTATLFKIFFDNEQVIGSTVSVLRWNDEKKQWHETFSSSAGGPDQ